MKDKKSWPLKPDVMYDDQWPMRQSSLLFAGLALNHSDYIELWKKLPADSNVEEVIRNFFIRQPVLWVAARSILARGSVSCDFQTQRPGREVVSLLNWSDVPQTISFRLSRLTQVTDFWSGEALGRHQGQFTIEAMPNHLARLLVCS